MTEARFVSRQRPEGVEVRPMGWWGTVLLVMVLATTYAALYFTYVYVRIASPDWPPPGIDPPDLVVPAWSAAALAASAVPLWWATRTEPADLLGAYRAGMGVAGAFGVAHVGLLLADWAAQPFTVDQHAYGSLYYVLPGIHLVIAGLGLLMLAVLLALSFHPEARARLHVGTRSLGLYWYATVAGGVILLAFVYLLPHVWREALAP